MKVKVLMILTNAYDPDPRVYKEAKTLAKNGYEVEVLAWDREHRYVDKEVEIIDDIKIKRFFINSKYGSGTKQIIPYISFIKSVRLYVAQKEFDYIHAHDVEGMLVAIFIKAKKNLIWDMHEFYDGFNYNKIRRLIYELIARICFIFADGIIFVIDSQKERYLNKLKKNTFQRTVMNCPDLKVFNNFARKPSKKLKIAFIGSVREFNTLKLLMDVAEKFDDVVFYIQGMGIAYNKIMEIEKNYNNTIVTGKFEYQNIKELYENADIIYSVYDSLLLNVREAFPVKCFESIVTETPIIVSENTFIGDFVMKNDIGFAINEQNSKDLENTIRTIITNPEILEAKAINIRKIKDQFSWEAQSIKLIELYNCFENKNV